MDAENNSNIVNVLPPFSFTFRDALREFRLRDNSIGNHVEILRRDETIDSTPNESNNSVDESVPLFRVCIQTDEPEAAELPSRKKNLDGDEAITLFPRRKAGQSSNESNNRKPLKLSVEVLETFYGVPLHIAARRLVSTLNRLLLLPDSLTAD